MSGTSMPDWDSAPEAQEVDLTTLTEEQRIDLLKSHIDEGKARTIVQRIDGSAQDYVANMRRINQLVGYLQFGLGAALRITRLA